MKLPLHLLLAGAAFLSGCSRSSLSVDLDYDRSVLEESRDGSDPGVATADAVIRSSMFWERCVQPRLSARLEEESAVKASLRLKFEGGGNGRFSAVTLTVSHATPEQLREVADAVIEGLQLYISSHGVSRESVYVRKKA